MEFKNSRWAALGMLMMSLLIPVQVDSRQAGTGVIRGRITDCSGKAIPGAEVTVTTSSSAEAGTAVADEGGLYRIPGLTPGAYSLTARLPNFRTFKRSGIEVPAGGEVRIDAGLQAGCGLGDGLQVLDLPSLWRSVDAVALLRMKRVVRSGLRSTQRSQWCEVVCTEYQASVLEVFRRYLGEPSSRSLEFLQADAGVWQSRGETRTGCLSPFPEGEELFVFARWNAGEQIFEEVFAIPVVEGKVKSPYIRDISRGVTAEAFVRILRSMMETPPPRGR